MLRIYISETSDIYGSASQGIEESTYKLGVPGRTLYLICDFFFMNSKLHCKTMEGAKK